MSKQIEAMKMALEALKTCDVVDYQQDFDSKKVNKAIAALREALAEKFCDSHCTWLDHHSDCAKAEQPAQQLNRAAGESVGDVVRKHFGLRS